MRQDLEQIVSQLLTNGSGSREALTRWSSGLNIVLPEDYVDFMVEANGGEGSVGDTYVQLWSTEQLVDLNEAYAVREFAPGIGLFGSDGGGTAYGFLSATVPATLVSVPFVGMAVEAVTPMGSTFTEFVQQLASRSPE